MYNIYEIHHTDNQRNENEFLDKEYIARREGAVCPTVAESFPIFKRGKTRFE